MAGLPTPWPPVAVTDDQTGYTLGLEFSLSLPCTLSKIWHYSVPSWSTVFPTRCLIWDVAGQTAVPGTDNTSPTWLDPGGGAATPGDGWVYCDYSSSGVTLQPGTNYKVSTFHSAGPNWFGRTQNVFGSGDIQQSGFTHGPLTIPGDAASSPGQQSLNSVTFGYPNSSGTTPEADWIDVEVTPVSGTAAQLPPLIPPGRLSPAAWQLTPYRRLGQASAPTVTGSGGVATPKPAIAGTGTVAAPGATYTIHQHAAVANGIQSDTGAYSLGMEFEVGVPAKLSAFWFYSATGAGVLPDTCAIYDANTQTQIPGTLLTSPSWSGAAGSGWVKAAASGITLQPGHKYSVVFRSRAAPTGTP